MVNNSKLDFMIKYKAALKADLTRQEFAYLMGIKPDTVIRRRHKILSSTGFKTELEYLPNGEEDFDINKYNDKIIKFNSIVNETKSDFLGKEQQVFNQKGIYVFTAAQNATPVVSLFLSTLKKYCQINDAHLNVIPYRYRNPTSIWTTNNEADEWWWADVVPYICNTRTTLCEGLDVLGELSISPTATRPLSGLESYSRLESAIIGHPKVEMRTIPTPSENHPKILITTGSCTEPNYTNSKAGNKGKFHHSIGAVIVEVDDDEFHLRRIHADKNGNFYDLEYFYTPQGRTKHNGIAAFVPGDIHAEFVDEEVEAATFNGPESIVETLKPKFMVYHDLEDFYRRNHHHKGNDVLAYGKHHHDQSNVEKGLQITADFIDRNSKPFMTNVVVRGNHDEAFDRWLREAEPKGDPENARFYHYMKYHQFKNIKKTVTGYETINAFEFWCKNPEQQSGLKNDKTIFLKRDESFTIEGIEVGFHGDIGLNGSRGSINTYSRIGPKVIIGHSHTPGICEGAYQVGVMAKLNLEYKSGPSSWMHTGCIVYPDGSRTLINVINGKWRASFNKETKNEYKAA